MVAMMMVKNKKINYEKLLKIILSKIWVHPMKEYYQDLFYLEINKYLESINDEKENVHSNRACSSNTIDKDEMCTHIDERMGET
jgi:hypothetical protein